MRRDIVHEGASQLTYEIREIVKIARVIESKGTQIHWENIGDPLAKGEEIAPWIKDIVADETSKSTSYGYTDSQGDLDTRQFISDQVNSRDGAQISMDDVIFFNGLGDAITKVYSYLKREARVLGPSPAYPTHSSAASAHSGYAQVTYKLDPDNQWYPDLEDIENKVKYNDAIAGILIINPDNPTGTVYSKDILMSIVDIAERYDLFIIIDETYANVTFPGTEWTYLSSVIKNVPAMSMRSLSKEVPWPGSRCGWIEVYNRDSDIMFDTYIESIISAKRLEVCSTTLPQLALPKILGNSKYAEHISNRSKKFSDRADEAYELLSKVDGITNIKPKGALYYTVLFDKLPENGTIYIEDDNIREFITESVKGVPCDKRFVYYLLGAKGICVVPLSGFYSGLKGFRFTLLEDDDEKRLWIYNTIAESMNEYLNN